MRIYLDVCCLNRPFDDQSQERIRLEAEAILLILQHIRSGEWQMIGSEMIADEIEQTPDRHRRERLHLLAADAVEHVQIHDPVKTRARQLLTVWLTAGDALHLACAEKGRADIFLTTDDRLQRRSATINPPLTIRVANPLIWLLEQQK